MNKPSISFCWQGLSQKQIYGQWGDGLEGAMRIIEKEYTVFYQEPWEEIKGDIILYWESPVTECGKDRENYVKIKHNPKPKILLFAGGQIKREWVDGFNLLLVESRINEEECEALGIPWMRAFGVNTEKMKPEKQPKVFDAVFPSTCAGWKRQALFSRALKEKGVLCGRFQESDPIGFITARANNTAIFNELPYHAVNSLYNMAHCCVNTSDYWGGGQRTTLESLATNTPVIVMADSPKNREYIEESGCGLVVEPNEEDIRKAIEEIKTWSQERKEKGRDYILKKYSHEIYAKQIIEGINKILKND